MKVYAQALERDGNGEFRGTLGSFGVLILDGRECLETWKEDGRKLAKREGADGFAIYRSSRFDETGLIYSEGSAR